MKKLPLTAKAFFLTNLLVIFAIQTLGGGVGGAASFVRCTKSYGGTAFQDFFSTTAADFNCDIDGLVTSVNNITSAQITDGAILDVDIAGSGITTRSKLPALLPYEDEVNVFTNVNTFSAQVYFNLGTITTDLSPINGIATWNNASIDFTGILLNITDTLSSAASVLMNLKVGGTSRFVVDKAGKVTAGTDPTTALDLVTLQYMQAHATRVLNKVVVPVTVEGTATETSIYSFTVPGGTLGTSGKLRLKILGTLQTGGGGENFEVRAKYGGTELKFFDVTFVAVPREVLTFEVELQAANSASVQFFQGFGYGRIESRFNSEYADLAITSTSDQTLQVTVKHANTNLSNSYTMVSAFLEIVN